MIRFFVVAAVLGAVWLHWRAAYTAEVRAALDDLAANQDRLDDLVEDLRDRRLVHRCKAALADHRAGDADLCREHVADALARLEHLERFAPLRGVIRSPKASGTDR